MTKNTFGIERDANGLEYIYQKCDETYKNHNENDIEISNQARIYEVPGEKLSQKLFLHSKLSIS